CESDNVQLNAGGGATYKWTPATGLNHDDIANPIATPAVTTTYHVKVSIGKCFDDIPVTVTVFKNPKANTPADKEIFEGESVTLDARPEGDNITYSWSPTTGLDNPFSPTPIASPTGDITYTLTVHSASCGDATGDVFVRVYKKIVITNTFTPNGDGINDTWQIKDLDTYPTSIVNIFNRAGQQVYHSIGYGRPWDGTYNGAALPSGTYYYVIDLKNKTPKRSGFIMLLR
ncbi:MAG: gliding motility-associated C-terminal domain-containing protein, partial [Mucilaginibacter sp.]